MATTEICRGQRHRPRRPVDARPLKLVRLCSHSFFHRHVGSMGGRCSTCKAMWCTIKPYDCEFKH